MNESAPPIRVVALWCPDWPVVAACAESGIPADRPAAVLVAHRVVACSATARAQGIRRGLRRREAQARCPDLAVLGRDADRDARAFEVVAAAVEEITPGVEVIRPGLVVLAARGPARYFGSEEAVAERLVDHVAARARVECQVGVADGVFAAALAARRSVVVPVGGSAEFLAPRPVGELEMEPGVEPDTAGADVPGTTARAELVGLLRRLGLTTLGDFARLPAADVASRFDAAAVRAHRLAQGLDERPPSRRRVPDELTVEVPLDPPVDRVDAAAFASRALAERLHTVLGDAGLACTRLGVQARTTAGDELARTWRCAEPLTPAATADRVRWQLEGWLSRRGTGRSGEGLAVLRLVPEEVVDAGRLQLGLWGETGVADERAGRALVRVQGLLGPEEVLTGVPGGGRGPGERIHTVPWGDERTPALDPEAPWPGALPAPSPSTVPPSPLAARVLDAAGRPVRAARRGGLSAAPAQVALDDGPTAPVRAWGGPWPEEGRWWDPHAPAGCLRVQVVCVPPVSWPAAGTTGADDGPRADGGDDPDPAADLAPDPAASSADAVGLALLLVLRDDRWTVEGIYD
ncbi:DNA polymerase Y family protein [Actinomycetospora endophytica]|uniref:DNA polymerase Y family protein n=1 Tax=Actinomycetospora endophytica TaxID=2291215 RepID=A0ABS8P2I9_9PSEU|nr:DNA polymerase Y family protein [Actinomycetospora endophytica]MCD2192456.1 DNA polymerase Y family protein [Actinomycetospora endophytica]